MSVLSVFSRSCGIIGCTGVVCLIGTLVGIVFGVFYFCCVEYVFIMRLNMGLYISVKVWFICNICLLQLYIWKSSSIFNDYPIF
jgi:hypothetical protein